MSAEQYRESINAAIGSMLDPIPEKTNIRVDAYTRWGSCWMYAKPDGADMIGIIGDWAQQGNKPIVVWHSGGKQETLSEGDRDRLKREAAEVRQRERETAKAKAVAFWEKLDDIGPSVYLRNKAVKAYGLKFGDGFVAVPARLATGTLIGVQRIYDDGQKKFVAGTQFGGAFHSIGNLELLAPIVVCEGYATGASINEATGMAVACAFSAGNLMTVAQAIRSLHPTREIIVAGDNDIWKKKNVGRESAEIAAKAVSGRVVLPEFLETEAEDKPTDFNDLMLLRGVDAVKQAFARPKSEGFTVVDFDSLRGAFRAPDWVVNRYFEEAKLAMIFGTPTAGKSLVSVDLACRIAAGMDWQGQQVKAVPVVYIAGEADNEVVGRILAWEKRHGVTVAGDMLGISTRAADLRQEEGAKEVFMHLMRRPNPPKVIFVDTLARNNSGDENSNQEMGQLVRFVEENLIAPFGAIVVLIHHTGHADKDRYRGASALGGAVRVMYRVYQADPGVVRMECKETNGKVPPPVQWDIDAVDMDMMDNFGGQVEVPVLDETEYFDADSDASDRLGKWDELLLGAVRDAMFACEKRGDWSFRVWESEIRTAFMQDAGAHRKAFTRARDNLIAKGFISIDQGLVKLLKRGGT